MTLTIPETDLRTLTELEEAMWRAETRFDPTFMERVLAADFFEFGRSGRIYSRQQTLASRKHEIEAELPLPDLQIRLLDETTAHVTYNSKVRYDGVVEHGRRSSIWSRAGNSWVLRFHQGTPCAP